MPADILYVAIDDPGERSDLLEDWTWLLGADLQPVKFTACGDVFLRDRRDGAIHFLDVNGAHLSRVAETVQGLEDKLADPAFAGDYLAPSMVDTLRKHGKLLKAQQVYSYRVPLALGGEVAVANVDVSDLAVHLSITGQIARQLKDVPDGAPIGKLDVRVPSRKPWWKFW